jgi:hypothetical protein
MHTCVIGHRETARATHFFALAFIFHSQNTATFKTPGNESINPLQQTGFDSVHPSAVGVSF